MALSFLPGTPTELKPRITVIGVGGAGGNAVNNMIASRLEGVEFIVANTDAQSLAQSRTENRIQLGAEVTQGLGAGSRPEVGRMAAEESMQELHNLLQGCNMVFITAGMGGGTGTGAAPVIARAARERGILTVGVVTKPFHFEGAHRMRTAEAGIEELTQFVDTLIIIPNQNLFRIATERTTFADAFKMADDVLHSGVRGVTDLMIMPGLINLDFADIRTVMSEMGKAMMGTGEAEGDKRSIEAAEAAISNPLLDDTSMKGAKGVLINITGGADMTLFEVDEAANRIRDEVDCDANIIFGSTYDEKLTGRMRVSVVATGIQSEVAMQPKPATVVQLAETKQPVQQRMGAPNINPAQAFVAPSRPATMNNTGMAATGNNTGMAATGNNTGMAATGRSNPMPSTSGMAPQQSAAFRTAPPQPQQQPITRAATATTAARMPEPMDQHHYETASQSLFDHYDERMDAAHQPQQQEPAPHSDHHYPDHQRAEQLSLRTEPNMNNQAPYQQSDMGRALTEMTAGTMPNYTPQDEPRRGASLKERFGQIMPRRAAPPARTPEPAPAPQQQPRMGNLESRREPTASRQQGDDLDIPAFLRRQAN